MILVAAAMATAMCYCDNTGSMSTIVIGFLLFYYVYFITLYKLMMESKFSLVHGSAVKI